MTGSSKFSAAVFAAIVLVAGCGKETYSARDPDIIRKGEREFERELEAQAARKHVRLNKGSRPPHCTPLSQTRLQCTDDASAPRPDGSTGYAFQGDATVDRRTGVISFD